jgi:hypothetical protein
MPTPLSEESSVFRGIPPIRRCRHPILRANFVGKTFRTDSKPRSEKAHAIDSRLTVALQSLKPKVSREGVVFWSGQTWREIVDLAKIQFLVEAHSPRIDQNRAFFCIFVQKAIET